MKKPFPLGDQIHVLTTHINTLEKIHARKATSGDPKQWAGLEEEREEIQGLKAGLDTLVLLQRARRAHWEMVAHIEPTPVRA